MKRKTLPALIAALVLGMTVLAPAHAVLRGRTRPVPRLLGCLLRGLPDLLGHPRLILGRVPRVGRGQVPGEREHDPDGHRADRGH